MANCTYHDARIEGPDGIIGDSAVEIPQDSKEYEILCNVIAQHPEWWEETNWSQRGNFLTNFPDRPPDLSLQLGFTQGRDVTRIWRKSTNAYPSVSPTHP
jgi:hypothetical protein